MRLKSGDCILCSTFPSSIGGNYSVIRKGKEFESSLAKTAVYIVLEIRKSSDAGVFIYTDKQKLFCSKSNLHLLTSKNSVIKKI